MNDELERQSDSTVIALAIIVGMLVGFLTGLILAIIQYLYPSIPTEFVIAGAAFIGVTTAVLSGYSMRFVVATVQVFEHKRMRTIQVNTRGSKKTWYIGE